MSPKLIINWQQNMGVSTMAIQEFNMMNQFTLEHEEGSDGGKIKDAGRKYRSKALVFYMS